MLKVDLGRKFIGECDVIVRHYPRIGSIAAITSEPNIPFSDSKVIYVAWVLCHPKEKNIWNRKDAVDKLVKLLKGRAYMPLRIRTRGMSNVYHALDDLFTQVQGFDPEYA